MTIGRQRRRTCWRLLFVGACLSFALGTTTTARAIDVSRWPVVGPVLRGFDPPLTTYGSGHRGIDIACRPGSPIVSMRAGSVTFAGSVGGQRYVTIQHADGLQSTVSWIGTILVRKSDVVPAGEEIATCGSGHAGSSIPHVHLGVRAPDGTYLDPLGALPPPRLTSFLRLAPR